ncbi:PAS domain-containing sensor histidine kinase [Bacteroidota bacterium]
MKSKTRLIIWLGIIFLVFLVCAIYLLSDQDPWLLILVEIGIPILFGITIVLINKAFQPIQTVSRGMNMLREGDFATTLVKNGNPEADGIVEVYNAMINRLREERLSVREKNIFLDLLVESSPLGIIIMDLDERIIDINPTAYRFMGLVPDDYRGMGLKDINNPLAHEMSKMDYSEKRNADQTGSHKYLLRKLFFMDHGFKHSFFLIEEFSEEIRQAEKSAYGKLIRMMAHEVNNTLGAVNSIISTVIDNGEPLVSEEHDEFIQMLGVALQRNYRLNRFMQNFSDVVKLPLPEKESFDLNKSLNNVILSLSYSFTERNIRIDTDFQQDQTFLLADQSQMEQVFHNIIKNSIESIGNSGSVKVSIHSAPLKIIISDDGPGLSGESIERLFTPFYSTKPDGQGIGLTLVKEILVNHGFRFKLSNREEKGAEFEIISLS